MQQRIMIPHANAINPEKYGVSSECAAPGAAVSAEDAHIDDELAEVIRRWPNLPAVLKAALLAMVRSS